MNEYIAHELAAHGEVWKRVCEDLQPLISEAANKLADAITAGGKVLLFGNGGSAADAQHIAAELVGRFVTEREGLPALALSTDTSALTSIGNDFGFEWVFARQLKALARKGDVVIAISTSGKSQNVNQAIRVAKEMECTVIGWIGKGGGAMAELCDVAIVIPSDDTQRIQEMHILIGHIMCGVVEQRLSR